MYSIEDLMREPWSLPPSRHMPLLGFAWIFT